MGKVKSRPQRWVDAVASAQKVLEDIEASYGVLEEAMSELRSVQEEYEEWKDNQPENTTSSPLGEKLEEVCGLEIEDKAQAIGDGLEEVRSVLDEAGAIDLPRGFGRD